MVSVGFYDGKTHKKVVKNRKVKYGPFPISYRASTAAQNQHASTESRSGC